jgi:hypothetical protein
MSIVPSSPATAPSTMARYFVHAAALECGRSALAVGAPRDEQHSGRLAVEPMHGRSSGALADAASGSGVLAHRLTG